MTTAAPAADAVRASSPSVLDAVRDDVRAIHAYAVPDASGLVKLDAMENPYGLPDAVREGLGRHLSEVALNRYPVPRYAALKDAIRAEAGVPDGFDLVLGNGSDEIISMLSVACAKPGAVVLAPVPGFVMYAVSAQLAGCRFVGVPLTGEFGLDVPAMVAAIREHRPAVTWIAHPNNPTGNAFAHADIEAVAAAAAEAGAGVVVIDEAYAPFADDTWLPRLAAHPNVAVMRTFSKMGLAGLRLGWIAGRPDLMAELDKVRPPYNVDVLSEAAAHWLLRNAAEVFAAQSAALRDERTRLAAALAARPGIARVFPSQANFVLVRLAEGVDASAVHAGVRERGVLVKDVSRAHPLLAGCLRLTVGSPGESAALLRALDGALAAAGGAVAAKTVPTKG